MKTFKQFYIEANFNLAKEVADNEINFIYSQGRPGHQARNRFRDNHSYAGKRAPCRDNPTKDCPLQVRHAQDLRAAQERSRQRRGK